VNRLSSPDPNDLDDHLSKEPLHKKGFTDELQQQILQAVDQKSRPQHRYRPLVWIASISVVVTAALLFPWDRLHPQTKASLMETASMKRDDSVSLTSPPPISSALLIGLRTEHEEKNNAHALPSTIYSTYRTMLIAPVRGELKKTAEGNGILMPYKQTFWKIDSLTQKTATDDYRYLSAHPAEQLAKTEVFPDNPEEELHHVETLVYAGNQYLSVAESEEAWAGNSPVRNDRIWVRTLLQLRDGRDVDLASKPSTAQHISIRDLYGSTVNGILDSLSVKRQLTDQPTEITGESWTIARTPGHWVPRVSETYVDAQSMKPGQYTLHEFPKALPEKVVSHDALYSSWSDIQSSWPKATDALTSPMNDLIVVFEENKMKFYPYGQSPDGDPLLILDLQPGEQLVMAQWATDHYVQDWINRVDKYLNP
jgi:hypothetical protein